MTGTNTTCKQDNFYAWNKDSENVAQPEGTSILTNCIIRNIGVVHHKFNKQKAPLLFPHSHFNFTSSEKPAILHVTSRIRMSDTKCIQPLKLGWYNSWDQLSGNSCDNTQSLLVSCSYELCCFSVTSSQVVKKHISAFVHLC